MCLKHRVLTGISHSFFTDVSYYYNNLKSSVHCLQNQKNSNFAKESSVVCDVKKFKGKQWHFVGSKESMEYSSWKRQV